MRGPLHSWPLTVFCSMLKNWIGMAIVALPSASSFAFTMTANPTRHRLDGPKRWIARYERCVQHHSLARLSTCGAARSTSRSTVTRGSAAAICAEDKVEEKRARLPEWEDIADGPMFGKLQEELTRDPFTDEAWEQSSVTLKNIAIALADSVEPFDEYPYLPLQHAAALSLVGHLTERSRGAGKGGAGSPGVPTGLYSSLKYSTKKNGVGRAASDVAEGFCPKYDSSRERLLAIRGVERCLAEFCIVWATARLLEACAPTEIQRDFVFHLRPLLEHAPARDRHEAVLVLCRGLFTPGHNGGASSTYDNVHGAALRQQAGGYPLKEAFAEVQRDTVDNPGGLRAARQAFPFLEILARWAWRCQTPEAKPKSVTTKRFGDKRKRDKREKGRAVAVAAKGQLITAEDVATTEEVASSTTPLGDSNRGGDEGRDNSVGGGEGTSGDGVGVGGGRGRGREDTGVASLLVALARADPGGDTIRSMQRWACEAILPEEVAEASSPSLVDRNEVAQGLMCTHHIFVGGQKRNRQRWMKACREIGEIIRLLVGALDQDRLEGEDVLHMVNHALFVTTFLRSMPQGVAARKGYEQLVAGGRVPGDIKSAAVTRRTNWREAVKVLDLGIASVLKASEETIRGEEFREALSSVLTNWQSPYALADYFVMQRKEREVLRDYLRFLRALLGVSNETVRDIRVKDPSNREHMQHFPKRVRQLWQDESSAIGGTVDPEIIFRMGEDTRSCMGIRRSCSAQNRALLGYLLQGNVRLVGVQSSLGRMEARAVLRLLLRSDNMTPVLFMDSIYYSTNPDTSLEAQVVEQAQSVSTALDVPLYRAGDKIPADREVVNVLEDEDDEQWDNHGSSFGRGGMSVNVAAPEMCELVEMDGLSSWVYSDGAVGDNHNPGMLFRDPYPGSPRKIVLAELEYSQQWDDFAF